MLRRYRPLLLILCMLATAGLVLSLAASADAASAVCWAVGSVSTAGYLAPESIGRLLRWRF